MVRVAARALAPLLLGRWLLLGCLVRAEAAELVCEDPFVGHCSVCEACCVHLEQEVCEACVQGSCEAANQCGARADGQGRGGDCNVCDACCRSWFAMSQEACDSCAAVKCHRLQCGNPTLECSSACLVGCWGDLDAPCLRDCMGKHGHNLLLLALLPFVGRLVWDFLWAFVRTECKRWCCVKLLGWGRQEKSEGHKELLESDSRMPEVTDGSGPLELAGGRRLTFKGFFKEAGRNSAGRRVIVSWSDACRRNDMSCVDALVTAAVRLFFWHLLQPIVYVVVLSLYWQTLSGLQQVLGALVAAREAQYFVLTLVCTFYAPAWLLLCIGESAQGGLVGNRLGEIVEEGRGFLTMYVLSPDKFVALVASKLYIVCPWWPVICGIAGAVVLDACSCVALLCGLCSGTLPPALAAGYVCTAMSAISFGLMLALVRCR